MRRTAAWKPIAGVAAATIAIAGFGVAPATAAPGDPSQALAEVLRAELLGSGLVQTGSAYASTPGGPASETDDLNVTLLDGSVELVSGGLQLPLLADGATPGLLDLGQAGLLSSYASTPNATSATASSGLLTDDGAIAFDVDEEPPTASAASLDATALLSQLEVDGLTDAIIDELGLTVGAVASRVTDTGAGATSEYRVADLTLDLHSDLVAGLSTELETALSDELAPSLQTTLDGVVGTGGALTDILGLLNLDLGLAQLELGTPTASITLADLSTVVDTALSGPGAILVSDDESVTVDLTDGTVTVDLAQLVNPGGTGLNGLDPNTEVLDADTIALITDGIANALGKIATPLTNAIGDVVDDSVVDILIPVTASALGLPVAEGSISIQGTITELVSATPTTAPELVDVNLTALGIINLDALTDAVVSLVVGSVIPPLGTALTGVLNASDTTVTTALQAVVDGLLDVLDPVLAGVVDQIASVTINAQPTLLGQPADIAEDGAFTVRALEITLLPDVTDSALLSLPFASSTVILQEVAAAGTLVVDPDRAHVGDTVDLSGDGWDPAGGDVTVTFTDVDGTQVGEPVVITPGADGSIAGDFTVPDGTEAGDLTATAVQGTASTTASLEVVDAPVVIVDPDPVDPGETLTITGTGFLCGPVTVTILDGDTVLETIEDIAVATDGTWSTTYVVPEDIDATTLTIRAVATGECGDEDETPVDVDLPEEFDVTQAEARVGDVLDITGDGWTEGSPVTVTFTSGTTTIGSPVVITPGTGGSLTGTYTVPTDAPLGPLTATAVQGDDSLTDTVTVFGAATVAVDPTSTRAGGVVDVTGTGWLPSGGDVVVTVTDADDAVVTTVTIPEAEIGDDGSIADEFTVPAGTDPGSLTVTAVQGEVDAATSLTVLPEPSVTVTPDTARPLDEVAVGGGGWGPGTVTVVFTDEDDQPVGDPLVLTPVDGVITGTFTVPEGTEPGTLTATATQGTDTDTAELEVTLAPTVTAAPPQVHGGDSVTIGGSGWGTEPVVVTITDGTTVIGTPITLTPVDGVITGSYPIPDGTDPADLTVTADDGADEATTVVEVLADAVVIAEPDPVDPGDPVTISGTGFLCGPVDVVITSGATTLATFTNVPVVDNEWTQIWTVPAGIAADSVTITATTAATAPCDDEGETDLEIDLDETLAATPATVQRGDVVTVTGTGWSDGTVSIIARGVGGSIVGSFTATSADASFSQPFTVPAGTPLGTLTFTAVQGAATETTSVTVVLIPTGPATLIASPSIVEPGDDVAIDGLGWDPTGPAVSVTIVDEDGAVVDSFPVAVLPDGRLATEAYTVPGTIDAPQTLTATGVQGTRSASDTIGVREANLPVIRLSGPQRWETSVEISRDAYPFGASVVYLASGENFPDALSAAPAAAQESAPLLLTQRDALPAAVATELDRLDPDVVVVVGGTAAISASVASAAGQYAGQLVRAGGANRFETSVLITDRAFDSASEAFIASGANFPDALTAGAAAGAAASPLLLTYGSTPSAQLLAQLDELGVDGVRIAGGNAAVPTSQEAGFAAAGFDVLARYAGANRYETGVLVAQDSFSGPSDRIYVATGERFPDALAGSAVAAAQNVPVYVSPTACLWGTIPGEIDRLDDPQVVLLGGTVALSDTVFRLETC